MLLKYKKPPRLSCFLGGGGGGCCSTTLCSWTFILKQCRSEDVTRWWFSELRPHGSSCCRRHHRRLSVCVSSTVLPLVFPPGVRGSGGGLVRGDHWRRRFRLLMDRNIIKHFNFTHKKEERKKEMLAFRSHLKFY